MPLVGADSAQDLRAWLQLALVDELGPVRLRELLSVFGSPQAVLQAGHAALGRVVSSQLASRIQATPDADTTGLIARSLEWVTAPDHWILALGDAQYPQALLTITDPPPLLYAKGNIGLLQSPALAIVGARSATAQGMRNAEDFARVLSGAGLTIVSGLALGIDAAAHEGGLRGPGSTIAVVGTGVDIVYPARNRDLAHRIAAHGLIVSEFHLGTPSIAHHFPRRNRIISALSRGVLVVEAAVHSGSLITARLAAEQGRDVFAIPGSIHSPVAKGCHALIKQGAKLVESAQDVLEELGPVAALPAAAAAPGKPAAAPAAAPSDDPVLHALGFDPCDTDTLAQRSGCAVGMVSARLLELELAGEVERLPGGAYQLRR
jgi:DNA processing protein